MRHLFKIILISLFLLSSDFSLDFPLFGKRTAVAGIFPDNKTFSTPPSHIKRYRKAGRKRLTTQNLRSSSKYIKLVNEIKKILSLKKNSEYTVLLSHWQIGEKIAKVTSDRESSRKFNEKLFIILSIDCKIILSELSDSVILYRYFPYLSELSPELSFSHYRIIIRIKDRKKREKLLKEAIEKRYNLNQLEKLVK